MNNFIKVDFKCTDPQLIEQLIALFSLQHYDGFEETDTGLLAYIEETSFDEVSLSHVTTLLGVDYEVTTIPQQNWNALWESNFEPVAVDDFCAIRAEFHTPISDVEHEVIITPKMSFGTGHHATTYLMVSEMRKLDFSNTKVADFGTGTGILAIMAEKLGASEIVAIDYDDWSIDNTLENIARNNCSKVIVLKEDHFPIGKRFDIILANINRNVIVDNLDSLVNGLTGDGKLLLSGLLKSDESGVVAAFQAKGLIWKNTHERDNWITILLAVKD